VRACTGGKTDESGNVFGAMFDGMEFAELYAYFREMHKQVTDHDIVAYADEYRGREPEKADLRQFYEVATLLSTLHRDVSFEKELQTNRNFAFCL